MVWDEGTIGSLKEFWSQGLSTAEIGRRLGVSKNAIVGKAHRLDLDARPSPIRRDAAKLMVELATPCPRTAGSTLPPLASADPPSNPLPASNIQPLRPIAVIAAPVAGPPVTGQRPQVRLHAPVSTPRPAPAPTATQPRRSVPACCWPIGDPGTKTFRFCDDVSVHGKPYCEEHAKLAYVRIRDRKEDAA